MTTSHEPSDTRRRLLTAAMSEFGSFGFDGASTAAIARAAGVTQPLVHYHFGSKEELWRQAVDDLMLRMRTAIDDMRSDLRDADPLTRLRAVFRRYVRFVGENPDAARILHSAGAADNERLRWIVETHVGPMQQSMAELVEEAQAAGLVRPVPAVEVLTILVGAAVNVFSRAGLYSIQHERDVGSPEYIAFHGDAVIEILFQGLVPRLDDVPVASPPLGAEGQGANR